jgi:hypothetical protein
MDGFVPFQGEFPGSFDDGSPGEQAVLEMCSVVMKAVQAHGPPGLKEFLRPSPKLMVRETPFARHFCTALPCVRRKGLHSASTNSE